jgi:uncharacterized membrane protein
MGQCASTLAILAAGLALTVFVTPVDANPLHHAHRGHIAGHSSYHSGHNVYLRRGYSRRGPAYGPGFGFATYAGDPFAYDDYYDGHRCYYLHRQDVCLGLNRPLDPFE